MWDGSSLPGADTSSVLSSLSEAWDADVNGGMRDQTDGKRLDWGGLSPPRALAHWFESGVACRHNPRLASSELSVSDGVLAFQSENQGVVLWGVREEHLEADDPPVIAAWNEGPLKFKPATDSVTAFALAATMIEIAIRAKSTVSGAIELTDPSAMLDWCVALPTRAKLWPERETRLFAGVDTVAVAQDEGDGTCDLWVAFRGDARARAESLSIHPGWSWVNRND